MLYLLDVAGDGYSYALAIMNFIAFGSLCALIAYIFCAAAFGLLTNQAKYARGLFYGSIFMVFILFTLHYLLLENFGIPVLVPPVGTPYFTEFMHVIQYIASISVIAIGAIIFITAALSKVDGFYGKFTVSGIIYLGILLLIHMYVEQETGIKIIFPPNLW